MRLFPRKLTVLLALTLPLIVAGCGGGGGGSSRQYILYINQRNSENGGEVRLYDRGSNTSTPLLNYASGSVGALTTDDDNTYYAVSHRFPDNTYVGEVRRRDGSHSDFFNGARLIAISPDGQKVAMVDNSNQHVLIATLGIPGTTDIFDGSGSSGPISLVWSPDSTKLLLTLNQSGWFRLATINADGSSGATPTFFTPNGQSNFNGRYSPDGSQIVFESNRDGNSEIYIMNADGTNQIRLTNNAFSDQMPSFSKHGTKILFVSSPTGPQNVWEMNVDGTGAVKVIDEVPAEEWPVPG